MRTLEVAIHRVITFSLIFFGISDAAFMTNHGFNAVCKSNGSSSIGTCKPFIVPHSVISPTPSSLLDRRGEPEEAVSANSEMPRRKVLVWSSAFLTVMNTGSIPNNGRCQAFDGGVGGLGKTKPETGVVFVDGSVPIQNNQGIVAAEILVGDDEKPTIPVVIDFQTPWPLLPSTSGLEARNLQQVESAFIQVVNWNKNVNIEDTKQIKAIIIDSVLGSKGKFGAYGQPVDIKVNQVKDEDGLFVATFTSYTPAMRESERKAYLKVKQPLPKQPSSLVILVTGTTRARFQAQQDTLKKVVDSFVAIEAPSSKKPKA